MSLRLGLGIEHESEAKAEELSETVYRIGSGLVTSRWDETARSTVAITGRATTAAARAAGSTALR